MQKNTITRYLTAPALAVALAAVPLFAQNKPLLNAVYLQAGGGLSTLTKPDAYPWMVMGSVGSTAASLGIQMRATQWLNVAVEGGFETRGSTASLTGMSDRRVLNGFYHASVLGRVKGGTIAGFQVTPQAGFERAALNYNQVIDEETNVVLGKSNANSRDSNVLIGAHIKHVRLSRWSLDFRGKYGLTPSGAGTDDYHNRSWLVQLRFDFLHR